MRVKIGKLAQLTGCKTVTIRYYEKEGLLKPSNRTDGNYRVYDDEDIERLQFIRHCRQHGISLPEIRELLAFRDNPTVNCDWINQLISRHVADLENQIRELRHLKEHLEDLLKKCSGGKKAECGILENLKNCTECAWRQQAGLKGK